MPRFVRLLLLTTTSFFVIGFLFVVSPGFSNNNSVLAACPEGYTLQIFNYPGVGELCVNDGQSSPDPYRNEEGNCPDEITVVGQTLVCTTTQIPDPPGTGPGPTCNMAVLFDPNPPVAGIRTNIVTPKPSDGIINPSQPRPSNYYFTIDDLTTNYFFRESNNVWTATLEALDSGDHYLTFSKSTSIGTVIRCGQQSFIVTESPYTSADTTGDLPENVRKVIDFLMTFGIGIAGGVAFLMLVYGSLKLVFSAGDPKAVGAGREVITAAIIGLLVVVFSVFLLRLIGISILGLPI